MMECYYPQEFPAAEIQQLYRALTDQDALTDVATVGKHIWVIQGYIQSFVLGDPDAEKQDANPAEIKTTCFQTGLSDRQGLAVMMTLVHPAALAQAEFPTPEAALKAYQTRDDEAGPQGPQGPMRTDLKAATIRGRAILLDTIAPILMPLLQRWLFMLLEHGLKTLVHAIKASGDPQMEQPMQQIRRL
jgi:hypothetical protein